eukprot:CAMPEP_0172211404 /NCGR_PEP_ID=MMETSP1050-20130122/36387_1 /TAXON_ID=233186 /ORGANISM="Cryptomonas curvata, Strain CCAP979/52" /LENGTH=154 /DNA_ID=CAMNT_0012891859 /DNA_START=1000 /DNA_END=1464 /DNA_ORIENTATION=+
MKQAVSESRRNSTTASTRSMSLISSIRRNSFHSCLQLLRPRDLHEVKFQNSFTGNSPVRLPIKRPARQRGVPPNTVHMLQCARRSFHCCKAGKLSAMAMLFLRFTNLDLTEQDSNLTILLKCKVKSMMPSWIVLCEPIRHRSQKAAGGKSLLFR